MKQPENKLDELTISTNLAAIYLISSKFNDVICLSKGRTRQSALKAAKRRLERLIRDIERMEKQDEAD